MGKMVSGFFGACAAFFLIAAASGAEPAPSLALDFSGAEGKIIQDKASGLTFALGKDAAVRDGALVVTGADQISAADPAAYRKWASGVDTREIGVSFWIRFDKAGAPGSNRANFGLFSCAVDKDRHIEVTLFTRPTELQKPVRMISTMQAEYGRWHHVEFSFSMNRRRWALYIDGNFQVENDTLLLPLPGVRKLTPDGSFRGAVKEVRFFEAALPSEELALCKASGDDFAALKKDLETPAASGNPHLKKWAGELAEKLAAQEAAQAKGHLTTAAYKRTAKSIANAKELAEQLAKSEGKALTGGVVTVYSVPVTSQDLYLAYDLPQSGTLTNSLEIIMAQDEFETASLIVVPFRPVKEFTMKMGDLKNGTHVLKGADVDIKIVKRWYRAGGAWLTYHVDKYMRALVPDMLLNDENLIQVDEIRQTNKALFHYPAGDHYVDVSEFLYQNQFLSPSLWQYFYDAPALRPVNFREPGRNRQYVITFRAKKDTAPGFYEGNLQLLADGKDAGTVKVTIRVLPFALPQPKTYYDVTKPYLSHVNDWPGDEASLRNGIEHNMMHLNGVAATQRRLQLSLKLGYPMKDIFCIGTGKAEFGGPEDKITPELQAQMDRIIINPVLRWEKMFERYSSERDYTAWHVNSSESGWYGTIARNPDRKARILAEKTHLKLFSHGMVDDIMAFSPGIYMMNSSSYINKDEAKFWHSFGGKNINYAHPFPGPENPGLMRRMMGLELYKANEMDGHMMHGYVGLQLNEFTKYPGGDGDYRGFELCFRSGTGVINKLAIIGYREGFDDVRYATLMKTQALDAIAKSKDELVKREAIRQLAWLERIDGKTKDMDDFRTQVQYRILVLRELIQARGGK